jgi:hypothetical protein
MVLAINLDDEPAVEADEVHDVSPERHLTTKAIAELLFPKMTPELSFGISHFAAEPTGSSLDDGFDAASIGAPTGSSLDDGFDAASIGASTNAFCLVPV